MTMTRKTQRIAADLSYSVKLIAGVASGFDGLQHHTGEVWEYCEFSHTIRRDRTGEYSSDFDYRIDHDYDHPHYTCVRWGNGSHCPLPIILSAESEYPLQNLVVRALKRLSSAAFEDARIACACYEHQWTTEEERLWST